MGMKINSTVMRVTLIVCVVALTLLIIFNFRTYVPFSIGVRVFQIPFFLAFAVAYAMGAVSWFLLARRVVRNNSSKIKSAESAKDNSNIKTES